MPVNTITYQPASGQLLAAYRPIVFKVNATATDGDALPPYVVCDIYIADEYYKSILRTAPESFTDLLSVFVFDISGALQEYFQPDIAVIDNNNLLPAPHMSAKVFCKFRSSTIDADGFTVEEPTKPLQGTRFIDPVSGTGLQSNSFFAINSALQHEDNQNLASHLATFRQGTWKANAFPLTHRNKYFFCPSDSDHFPVIFTGDCLSADIVLNYRLRGQPSFQQATAVDINVCAAIGFSLEVTANKVDVTLDEVPTHSVVVRYKKQADSVWIDAGEFTTETFFFNVNGSDIAGDYDIQVIHFCSACLSADPEVDEFTLSGTVQNLDWRGIDPFCVVQAFDDLIYVVLEIRNPTIEDTFYPNEAFPYQKTTITSGQLYAKFYSDATHLVPLSVVENDLKVFVKRSGAVTEVQGSTTYNRTVQDVLTFTVDASGVEVLLGTVETQNYTISYSPYPTISATSNTTSTYSPFPDHELTSGNTGEVGYATLQEYNTDTDLPTGNTKPNDVGDPDYVPPIDDEVTCPSGAEYSTVTYGYGLDVIKVELGFNGEFVYSTPIANTGSGAYVYVLPVPKNTDVNIVVKARTLDGGNASGIIKVRVNYIDNLGGIQVATFNVPNNVETGIPQTFRNITNVNISNY